MNGALIAMHGGKNGWMTDLSFTRSQLLPMVGISVGFAIMHTYSAFIPVAPLFLGKNPSEGAKYIMGRIPGNMQEWEVAFMSLFWMYGLFFNPELATYLGAGWLLSRFLYPFYYAYY